MTDLDQRLRAELSALVDTVTIPELPDGPSYRLVAGSRWPRVYLATIAAAAAVALLITGIVVVLSGRQTGVPAAGATYSSWPTRGSLANDAALQMRAIATWNAAPVPARELPHRGVRVLYATRSVAGDSVVLTGTDAFGRQRIAWLNTDPTSRTPFRARLHLVADVLAPTGNAARLINLFSPRPTPRPTDDMVLIALAPPGTVNMQWRYEPSRTWEPLVATDGAAVVVARSTGVASEASVRVGTHGNGVQSLDRPWDMGPIIEIAHDLDPQEVRPSKSAHCSGGGACLIGATSGMLSAGAGDEGGWTDLRQSLPEQPGSAPNGSWGEFASEVMLLAETRHPNDGSSFSTELSTLLPDNTGVILFAYQPSGGTSRLMFYVDRPEWYAGVAADIDAAGPLPAVATTVHIGDQLRLIAVATDGLRIQWSAPGRTWTTVSTRDHIAMTAIPAAFAENVKWRAVDDGGKVVASGAPSPMVSR
jgi:hypothetical protein